ncbi:MAG: single-stranded-DNA-specific exonuclease RecJ [Cyanobacteria bacterium DS2.3.42]|nr:single-stranded-DNA-specific exonuclease RecJ [Cyanobacteria bacterium DS2.3.42]
MPGGIKEYALDLRLLSAGFWDWCILDKEKAIGMNGGNNKDQSDQASPAGQTGASGQTGQTGPTGSNLSARGKVWLVPKIAPAEEEMVAAAGGSELIARLLAKRGFDTAAKINAFLDSTSYIYTNPLELPDVDKAVARLTEAISMKEQITVYGDYDVDGVTGTSVLMTVLKRLGASVNYYIPHRTSEGYGLNLKAVSILASKQRTKLIVTCDCGVSNFSEINFARSLGVDSLVLDHHTMPEILPPAIAIVHPKRLPEEHPLFHLPGVGVAYKVCEQLLIDNGYPEEVESLLDFVVLGMIADLVPLIGENRHIVRNGLQTLLKSPRPGMQALLGQVQKSSDTDMVAFGIAPRINAVGRLADANTAVELLTTNDASVAENIAKQLQLENSRRQDLCEKIFLEADKMVQDKIDLSTDRCIAIYKEGWHHGVVGIVASKLVEKYNRPVFIGELEVEENVVKGSARGVEAIDLYQVLKANEHLLSRWGGHKMAAGWGVEGNKADVLCRALTDTCNKMLANDSLVATLNIDAEALVPTVDIELARSLQSLAPFGMGNRKPIFILRGMTCQSTRVLGKDGKHHRVMLEHSALTEVLECVMWNTQGIVPPDGQRIDVAFTPEVNSYNGRDRLQLVLTDWRIERQEEDDIQVVHNSMKRSSSVPQKAPAVQKAASIEVEGLTAMAGTTRDLRSQTTTWKDLREFDNKNEVLKKAAERLGTDFVLFSETVLQAGGLTVVDRTALNPASNLIIWQYPPSSNVLKEVLDKVKPKNVFVVGQPDDVSDDASVFLKRLLGLIKYAVNNKEGQVEGEKLAALMGTSKMAIALALTLLRKIHVVDWFAEEGLLFLDLIGAPETPPENHPEFKQLSDSLQQVKKFRQWMSETSIKEIQLAVATNQIELVSPRETDSLEQPGEDMLLTVNEDFENDQPDSRESASI